jgi:glycosyltransferase involved in cell wall biosynthesis
MPARAISAPPADADALRPSPAAEMRVLHLTAPAAVGGLERVVQALTTGHRRLGHRVHVAAVLEEDERDHPFLAPLLAAGVDIHPLLLPPRAYALERRRIADLCRRLRPDVVHCHGYRVDVVDAPVPRRLGIPVVSTVHGFTGGDRKNRFFEWLQRRSLRRRDAVAAVSRPLLERLQRAGVARALLIPNAWDGRDPGRDGEAARRALRLPPDAFVVGWVGRLSGEKGPDVLIDALALLPEHGIEAVLVGDGPERASLEARAATAGLVPRVRFLGRVDGAESLFPAFDALALSSRTEGTPMVLFEAMAAGTPIVAARVGGVPDVLADAEALLVPPEDPAALARALAEVRREPRRAAGRAAAARRRLIADFAPEPWLARYESLYRELQLHPRRLP